MSCLLTICIAFRQCRVNAAYASHVHPDLILCKSCDKDSTCYRKVESVLASLDELVTETHCDEVTLDELLLRHSVHIIDLRLIYDSIAELLNLDASHVEHKSRRLHTTVLITLVANDTCTVSNVSVTCTVDNCLCKNCLTACLRLDDNTLHNSVLNDCVSNESIKKNINAALFHNLECKVLHLLAINHCEAGVEMTWLVAACSASFSESVNEFLRIALDDVVTLRTKECKNRKTDCKVTTEEASALDEHHLFLTV